MQDYSTSKEEKNNFIRFYEVDEARTKIFIYKANDEIDVQPYSKELEKAIIKQMRKQVSEATKTIHDIDDKAYKTLILEVIGMIACFITTLCAFVFPILIPVALIIFFDTLYLMYKEKKLNDKIKDIEKHNYFLDKETLINDEDIRIKAATRTYNKSVRDTFNKKGVTFTINDCETIKFEDLQALIDNIDHCVQIEHSRKKSQKHNLMKK